MRVFSDFFIKDPELFIRKLTNRIRKFSEVCILNSNNYRILLPFANSHHSYDFIAAAGSLYKFTSDKNSCLPSVEQFIDGSADWLFGHLSYDLKNEIESLTSSHPDLIGFPLVSFFVPQYIFILLGNNLKVGWHKDYDNEDHASKFVCETEESPLPDPCKPLTGKIKGKIAKSEYLGSVGKIKSHIEKGDIYEVNYCQEFFADKVLIDPLSTWLKLIEESPTPFSCYYRHNDKYLLCASPERFLKKTGNRIISQPIKGTSKRGKTEEEEMVLAESLASDIKERAENIMVTDLVRNDLSRIASEASVRVDELCGIYPFPRVFHMISTISAELAPDISFTDVVKAAFPMGSMTGTPKIRAMEIIEQYERSRRGLFSGTVGYITPGKDFDFNVVIRSIQYNQTSEFLSFMAGGAITNLSVPEKEYHECLLKAGAIATVLGQKLPE